MPVFAFAMAPISMLVLFVYTLIIRPDYHHLTAFVLVILAATVFPLYVFIHQSNRLRLKKIITQHNKAINREIVLIVIDKMGWVLTRNEGAYIEMVPQNIGFVSASQMMAIVIGDHKVLLTSLSRPDDARVQGGWSFGRHKKNVEEFIALFRSSEIESPDIINPIHGKDLAHN
jgi:hypothetical protein